MTRAMATNIYHSGDRFRIAGETDEDRAIRGVAQSERLEKEAEALEQRIVDVLSGNVSDEHKIPEIVTSPQIFMVVTFVYIFLMLTLLITSIVLIAIGKDHFIASLALRHVGTGLFALFIVLLALSWGTVRQDELGGLTFFHKPVFRLNKPGPVFQPIGLLHLETESGNLHLDIHPGPAESVVRHPVGKDGNTPVEVYEPGQIRPVFVQTGPPTTKELEALKLLIENFGLPEEAGVLFRPLNIDVRWSTQWKITDSFLYEREIEGNNRTQRSESMRKILREASETEIREIMANMTPATAIQCLEAMCRVLTARLRLAGLYQGIWFERLLLTDVNLSHGTNHAQSESVRSAFNLITTRRNAEGEEYTLVKRGAGEASAVEAELRAKAEGYKAIAEALELPERQVVLLAETAARVTEKATYSLFGPSGTTEFLAAVSAAKAVLPAGTRPPTAA